MRVICIKEPPKYHYKFEISIGSEYEVLVDHETHWDIIDDIGETWAYDKDYFNVVLESRTNTVPSWVGEPTEQAFNGEWVMQQGMTNTIKVTRQKLFYLTKKHYI